MTRANMPGCVRSVHSPADRRAPTRGWVLIGAVVLGFLAPSLVSPAPALAVKTTFYAGIHPLPPHAGAFCYIDFPHVHAQPPSDMRAYRVLADHMHVFVGDEVALGFDGAKYAYFGPHPISPPGGAGAEPLYCYLRGAHYHAAPPAPAGAYVMKDGVAWFNGTFSPAFGRDRFNIWVNDMRPIAGYKPPAADLGRAPPGYHLPDTVLPPPSPPAPPATIRAAPASAGAGASSLSPAKKAAHDQKGKP